MNDPTVRDLAVIGAGAWGTALAVQAARAGSRVTLWARHPGNIVDGENPRLPGIRLPETVTVTGELPSAPLVLLVVPLQHMREVAARLPPGGPLAVCAKGVEAGTRRLPLEVLAEILPGRTAGVLTGPNFAHEVAAGLPAATVIAALDPALREAVAASLGTPSFRIYGNDDPVGAEVGGAAKNVVAIAAGAVVGAGLGENARAALVTRGLAEIARLAVALGGRAETVAGLSGLGDLMLTCAGVASRNYSLGLALGRGERLEDILGRRSAVTEGVMTAPALIARAAELGEELPVCAAVAAVVTGQMTVLQAMETLLSRPRKDE
ncbi:Glycerol-3-phosphate dehydrogenase [NAD(P)+] [Rhodovastum atsumiense]|uniref:Glycerol-3-phosphate dehydrogenase [NAD(P)+] n=1 Tax=Rhodovastum atsumiense TaxID=504468 RepID=A0A5M6IXV6_9PROT|nr:NAD(P)H-dependent glycerol-3-phosphate dehydrogenase [Rhodovastum atsumiense]KAA5613173.1 NAD(P)-dependent glycerol-3-phosphate dehydrogenase [Rhodovastum atsumiense]CAH2600677.1 Glycerol-3-phosphate dehydrogenase [NAD(P)+] [Rhodovastum atsumiense]